MKQQLGVIHVALPAMNEADYLPGTLECLFKQSNRSFHLWVCVNQPDRWWDDPYRNETCKNNRETLNYLSRIKKARLHVIDRSSKGKGWNEKAHGVGQARKVVMDSINEFADENDIILSLDADTAFHEDYLASVKSIFLSYPNTVALSNPYYHELSGDEALDRSMLRYEIYMRHYAINMWRIGSPYSYTALGSAIALPVWAYRKIGGITAKKSGEDFYFLQKLRKTGWICNYNTEKVYPGTRYSDRVFFGTGPALIKGSSGDWESYPIYDHRLFEEVKTTYELFPQLYRERIQTPMSAFLAAQFRDTDPFEALRKNASNEEQFVAACHQKIDGLRVLQFLKSETKKTARNDEAALLRFFDAFYPQIFEGKPVGTSGNLLSETGITELQKLSFENTGIALLNKIRNILQDIETAYQQNDLP